MWIRSPASVFPEKYDRFLKDKSRAEVCGDLHGNTLCQPPSYHLEALFTCNKWFTHYNVAVRKYKEGVGLYINKVTHFISRNIE